jgi:hypothetical protein
VLRQTQISPYRRIIFRGRHPVNGNPRRAEALLPNRGIRGLCPFGVTAYTHKPKAVLSVLGELRLVLGCS